MKINITGDVGVLQSYDSKLIDNNIIQLFKNSDLNIVNLEAPVTISQTKILKTGPHIKADKESTKKVLEALNVDVVTLANNHILDYGEQGVEDTLKFCEENNIQSVGAGRNLNHAARTLYLNTKEGKIAIVNFAENEWASATEGVAGANPMDIVENVRQIKKAKAKAKFVFVIVHGGHEYYNLPSPRMQKQYRFYAEEGADIIIGHHTHCIIGNEKHNGVPIFYSLGNFLFTKPSDFETWYTGLVIEIEVKEGELFINQHPIRLSKEDHQLKLLKGSEKEVVSKEIEERNKIITNPSQLKDRWDTYVDKKYRTYLNSWSPSRFLSNRYLRGVFNRLIAQRFLNKKGMALSVNLLRCEAHKDLSEAILLKFLKK